MLKSDIRLIAPCRVQVSESPVWEASRRQLHFVDIYGARIGSIDWASGALSWIVDPEPVGCVGLAGSSHFAAGLASGMALIDRSNGRSTPLGDFAIEPGNRLNDGRCAPGGRHFWVGSMVETLDRAGGHLYRVDASGFTWTMASDITCSNGLAWSPDGQTMYHADLRQSTVWAYDYDIAQRRASRTSASSVSRKRAKDDPTAPRWMPRAATGARATMVGASSAMRRTAASCSS